MPGVVHVRFEVPDTFRVFGLSVRGRIPGPYSEKFAREACGPMRRVANGGGWPDAQLGCYARS
jgi:hypothetical protein